MGKKLYFVQGAATAAEAREAACAGALIRNALAWTEGDFVEQCEEAMDAFVPPPYLPFEKSEQKAVKGKDKKAAAKPEAETKPEAGGK